MTQQKLIQKLVSYNLATVCTHLKTSRLSNTGLSHYVQYHRQ